MKLSISKYSNRFFIPCQDAISKQQKLDTILEIFGLIVGHDDAINEVMSAGVQTNFAAPTN